MRMHATAAKIVVAAVSAAVALTLAACSGQAADGSDSDATASTSASSSDASDSDQSDASRTDSGQSDTTAGMSGYITAINLDPSQFDGVLDTYVSDATISDGTLAITGSFGVGDTEADAYEASATGETTYTLAYDDSTTWTSTGGDAGTQAISIDEFRSLLDARNGLGLTIQAQDGHVVSADLSS